jgi:ATP synthase protein I
MAFNRPIPESHRPASQGPDAGQRSKLSSGLASLAEAEKMVQISILLPSSAFVGWLMGAGLDKLLHQTWISLVGILFGGVSGLVYVVRMVIATKPGAAGRPGPNAGPGAGSGQGSSADQS